MARIVGGDDGNGSGTGPVVVLLHGYGAPGDDLVPIARELNVPKNVRFVFPEAPHDVLGMPGARAWWPLDIVQLQYTIMKGLWHEFKNHTPPELPDMRKAFYEFLEALYRTIGGSPNTTILGGFSQGSMFACDATLRSAHAFAGLALLSPSIICVNDWNESLKTKSDLPVFMSHGTADGVLPFELANELYHMFTAHKLHTEFIAFNGGHTLTQDVINGLSQFIRQCFDAR